MGSFPAARAQALMTANSRHILLWKCIEHQANRQHTKYYHVQPHRNSSPYWESGQQYKFSFLGHALRLPDNKPVREFVMYRFQLRGGGNPEDSEPCSPVVYLLSSGGSWYPVKWQSAVANGSRPPSMEEKLVVDCSSAEGWWWWTSKQKLQGVTGHTISIGVKP